jgi:hypothetical protein
MTGLVLFVLLFGQPVAGPGTELRALTVRFVDEQRGEVTDLGPADVALTENGVAREITSFKRDRRPLSVAVIVDSSAALGAAYRLRVVDAVVGFVNRLPEGTRYALWTSGDRPTKRVDFTEDREAAGKALRLVAPQGGNYMLDALVEASADLKKFGREGDRTAVVAVSGSGPELSYLDKYRCVSAAEKNSDLFAFAQVDSSESDDVARLNLSYAFDHLAAATGGRYDTVLSEMGLDATLRKTSTALSAGYRVVYATVPDLKNRRLEMSVARPKTKALLPVTTDPEAPGR